MSCEQQIWTKTIDEENAIFLTGEGLEPPKPLITQDLVTFDDFDIFNNDTQRFV